MYVVEYLEFLAGIYSIKNYKERINAIIEQIGLTVEKHKNRTMSKDTDKG